MSRSKWKFRGCPRCHGDVYFEEDNGDVYERCLQCGYSKQTISSFDARHYSADIKKSSSDRVNKTIVSGVL
jgi:hypothetical protein